MLTVVCFKWFDPNGQYNHRFLYTFEHVNRLARMVSRNLALPHEFVCITDDAAGLDASIRVVPIDRGLLLEAGYRYPKLMIFRPDAGDWLGRRILMLDLDTVIVAPLDPLVSRPEPLVLWQDPSWQPSAAQGRYNTSIVLLTAGSHPDVWTGFDTRMGPADSRRKHSDQAWIWQVLGDGLPVWTQADGVLSFRKHVMRRTLFRKIGKPFWRTRLPRHAKIVFLHGGRDPASRKFQNHHFWIYKHWR